MKKLFTIAALFLASAVVQAGTQKTTADSISLLRAGNSGNTLTLYKNVRNTVNPANCPRTYPLQLSQLAFVAGSNGDPGTGGISENGYDQAFSALMAAKISNRDVVFYISDDRCSGNFPSIIFVEVL